MRKFLLVLFIFALTSAVQANIITYTDSINGLFKYVPNRDLAVSQFNPALGTLNSVTMELSTAIESSLGFENLVSFERPNIQVTTSVHGYIALGYMLMSNFTGGQTHILTIGAFDGIIDYAGTSGTILETYSDADTGTFNLPFGSDFSQYIGLGSVLFPLITDSFTDHITKPANSAAIYNTTAEASVTITYDYTPVPEPATIAILAIGGLFLKRKIA